MLPSWPVVAVRCLAQVAFDHCVHRTPDKPARDGSNRIPGVTPVAAQSAPVDNMQVGEVVLRFDNPLADDFNGRFFHRLFPLLLSLNANFQTSARPKNAIYFFSSLVAVLVEGGLMGLLAILFHPGVQSSMFRFQLLAQFVHLGFNFAVGGVGIFQDTVIGVYSSWQEEL